MASVRMTNELRNDIFRAAEAAYETANPFPVASTEFVDKIRDALTNSLPNRTLTQLLETAAKSGLSDRPKQANNLPVVREIQQIHIRKLLDDGHKSPHLDIKFSTPVEIATIEYRKENLSWSTPEFFIEDCDPNMQTELFVMFDQLQADIETHRDDTAEYRDQIRNLLEKCTTLKQLLEVWPAAESLVPSDKLQKMHEKVTRKQRAQTIKEEINFDPTVANQAVLTSKMLGV